MPYVTAYVLYIIGSVILPDKTGNYVPIMYLQLLRDQEDFDRYAWGAAFLCHLHSCFDNFLKDSKCLAGSTFSLMIFAIERVPCLGLYLMGKEHPNEQELQNFVDTRPKEFPLLQSWANMLHPFFNNNHEGGEANSVVNILMNLQPQDICWDPYLRLGADFLPQRLNGQQHMGLSHTILLCFEKVVYHRPELCPKQFGVGSVRRPNKRDLVIIAYNRWHSKDWRTFKKMLKYNSIWQGRRDSFIAPPPIHASSSRDHMDVDAGGSASNRQEPGNEGTVAEPTPFEIHERLQLLSLGNRQESIPFDSHEQLQLLSSTTIHNRDVVADFSLDPSPPIQQQNQNLIDDDYVILGNKFIRASFDYTTDICRTRTMFSLRVWKLNKILKNDNIFFDPIITGLSADLCNVMVSSRFGKTYVSRGKQRGQTEEASAAQAAPPIERIEQIKLRSKIKFDGIKRRNEIKFVNIDQRKKPSKEEIFQ